MSWVSALRDLGTRASTVFDADRALMLAMAGLIEHARSDWPQHPELMWRPGEPLRLLFAGYSGTRNTGADVRVEAMVAQFRHVLGARNLDLTLLTQDVDKTKGYFRGAKQALLPQIFPAFLHRTIRTQHGVIACEGSMFKSKFANALSTFMTGSLGLAVAGEKLAIAYGGEAGAMSPDLEAMVRRYLKGAWVLTRNEESQHVLDDLGIDSTLGTDTAWSFEPAPPEVGAALLRAQGWDGRAPILAICPINAFWWPVTPDLARTVEHALTGRHEAEHYASLYFHKGGARVKAAQQRYIEALAGAARTLQQQTGAFVVCIGMEALDKSACEALAGLLDPSHTGLLVSDEVEMFELVSVLRHANWLISSRYHALVTSMPAGVVGIGITMDERIRNLMRERGTPEFALSVDDEDLEVHLLDAFEALCNREDAVRDAILRASVRNLRVMGEMGRELARHVAARLPGFPLPEGMGHAPPSHHLPPLSPTLIALCEAFPEEFGS